MLLFGGGCGERSVVLVWLRGIVVLLLSVFVLVGGVIEGCKDFLVDVVGVCIFLVVLMFGNYYWVVMCEEMLEWVKVVLIVWYFSNFGLVLMVLLVEVKYELEIVFDLLLCEYGSYWESEKWCFLVCLNGMLLVG